MSITRKALSRRMAEHGPAGVLLVRKTADGAVIPPGSMTYPPCHCPRCRVKPVGEPALRVNASRQTSSTHEKRVRK